MADGTLLDEAFRHLGRYGRYQLACALILSTVGNWLPAWHLMGIIFTADTPVDFYCVSDWESTQRGEMTQYAAGPVSGAPSTGNFTYDAAAGTEVNVIHDVGGGSVSLRPENVSDECIVDDTGKACTEWQYVTLYGETTIVSDLNLVCDRAVLTETAQSIFLVGTMLGSLLFGFLSDAFGRTKVLLLGCLAHGVCGCIAAFVWNYAGFVTLWFLVGMFSQGYNQVQFVIVMEMFPPECRTRIGSLSNMFWGLGVITLTPLAYLFKNWRHMQLAISVPCLVALPLWFVLDESVRWLIAKGRLDEAERVLNKMARWNRIAPPSGGFVLTREDEQAAAINVKTSDIVFTESVKNKPCTYLDVLKCPRLLVNTIIIYFSWSVSMMTYYGASLNSTYLSGSKYVNFFLLGLTEIPAFVIIHFTMSWWGRRPSLGLFLLLAGLASITTAIIPNQTAGGDSLTGITVTVAILAKLCIACACTINMIFCSEVFPTSIRSVGYGVGSVVGNIGTVIAPFILYLNKFASFLPLTIFGCLGVAASALIPILPETINKPLPETIEDAKRLGRRRPRSGEIHRDSQEQKTDV